MVVIVSVQGTQILHTCIDHKNDCLSEGKQGWLWDNFCPSILPSVSWSVCNFLMLWLNNRWTDWLHLKFCGTILVCTYTKTWAFAVGPLWEFPSGTQIFADAVTHKCHLKFMELSLPIDIQCFAFSNERHRQGTSCVYLEMLIFVI